MNMLKVLVLFGLIYCTLSSPVAKRDVRDDLLEKADSLDKEAAAEVKKLRSEGRTTAADELEAQRIHMEAVAGQLKAATDPITIERLELELAAVERHLEETLAYDERTASPSSSTRAPTNVADVKSDLLKKAESLDKEAAAEVKKLRSEGRTTAADELEAERAHMETVAKELKAATDPIAIERLELELGTIEKHIEQTLAYDERTASPSSSTRAPTTRAGTTVADVKSDLLKKAESLDKEAAAEVKKLRAAGRDKDADELEAERANMERAAAELKAATDPVTVERLELQLEGIEKHIEETLAYDERTASPSSTTRAA